MGLSDNGIKPICVGTQQDRALANSLRTDEYRRIIANLKAARISAGLTQAELAALLGRHQSFIAKTENCERRLDIYEFQLFAAALSVSVVQLLRDAPPPV
jgi:ribosome-binding protein aMBF1 (putative translation factor)